jgi:hypothetical protein
VSLKRACSKAAEAALKATLSGIIQCGVVPRFFQFGIRFLNLVLGVFHFYRRFRVFNILVIIGGSETCGFFKPREIRI